MASSVTMTLATESITLCCMASRPNKSGTYVNPAVNTDKNKVLKIDARTVYETQNLKAIARIIHVTQALISFI